MTERDQLHNPSLNGVVINARDVSESQALHDQLRHEAEHDALTGLPNRRRMRRTLNASLRTGPVALLLIDLDGFKPVNDRYGHETGDELLRQAGVRLSDCVREQDVVSRVGGDEFVIVMPGVHDRTDAELMAGRLRAELGRPFPIAGDDITIGGSVGVHLAAPEDEPDQALRAADEAMYAVKQSSSAGRR
ncbi:diguanylate cyclase domain-containing protein [Micromonosporaceae bacterium Da 78-11]